MFWGQHFYWLSTMELGMGMGTGTRNGGRKEGGMNCEWEIENRNGKKEWEQGMNGWWEWERRMGTGNRNAELERGIRMGN